MECCGSKVDFADFVTIHCYSYLSLHLCYRPVYPVIVNGLMCRYCACVDMLTNIFNSLGETCRLICVLMLWSYVSILVK